MPISRQEPTITIALKFREPDGAHRALSILHEHAEQGDAVLYDAATSVWEEGTRRPKSRRPRYLSIAGTALTAVRVAAYGVLYIAVTAGASVATFAGRLLRAGIDPGLFSAARNHLAEGNSLLVVVVDRATADGLEQLLEPLSPQVLAEDE